MAKTEKVVDLKPTKITDEQLKQLQGLVSDMNKNQMEIGRYENAKHQLLHQLGQFQNDLTGFQKELEEEYGTVNVNINDGTINYDVEANKKD
tara:strand:+ start:1123 stop:1398 length:276 start_codon:yes stop_codon:yes gene_type:complete